MDCSVRRAPNFGPQNGKGKVHPDGCGLPLSEHDVLFRRREVVETLGWSLRDVEVEVDGQSGLQLSNCVELVGLKELSICSKVSFLSWL